MFNFNKCYKKEKSFYCQSYLIVFKKQSFVFNQHGWIWYKFDCSLTCVKQSDEGRPTIGCLRHVRA